MWLSLATTLPLPSGHSYRPKVWGSMKISGRETVKP
jgi:hypothetical protein